MSACAIGSDVNEYAWTKIVSLADFISLVIASAQPPLGEK